MEPGHFEGSLLVGIANPATMPRLMQLATHVALTVGCDITATRIVTVPGHDAPDLPDDSPSIAEAHELLRGAVECAQGTGVAVDPFVEVAQSVPEGLTSAVQVEGAGLLMLGYSDDTPEASGDEKAFDRIIHQVARSVACDLVVCKFRADRTERVVAPISGDPGMRVSALICRALAEQAGASIHFVHIAPPGAPPSEGEPLWEQCSLQYGLDEIGQFETIRSPHPDARLLEEVNGSDLAILVTPGRSGLARAIFGTQAERIASQATATVLLARAGSA
ncbi:MAG: universal stress protein [Armatimonadetes bacterium]|nr:universal stress protein [Armatimonadota bacterium]